MRGIQSQSLQYQGKLQTYEEIMITFRLWSQSLQYQGKLQTSDAKAIGFTLESQSLQYQGKLQTKADRSSRHGGLRLNPFNIRENCRRVIPICTGMPYRLNPFNIRENCRQNTKD